jgi:hypothetical protein
MIVFEVPPTTAFSSDSLKGRGSHGLMLFALAFIVSLLEMGGSVEAFLAAHPLEPTLSNQVHKDAGEAAAGASAVAETRVIAAAATPVWRLYLANAATYLYGCFFYNRGRIEFKRAIVFSRKMMAWRV